MQQRGQLQVLAKGEHQLQALPPAANATAAFPFGIVLYSAEFSFNNCV
jgi:hypothetical protein